MVEPFVSKRDKTASEEAIRKEKGMARLKRVGVNRKQEAKEVRDQERGHHSRHKKMEELKTLNPPTKTQAGKQTDRQTDIIGLSILKVAKSRYTCEFLSVSLLAAATCTLLRTI